MGVPTFLNKLFLPGVVKMLKYVCIFFQGPPHWVAGAMGNATWSGPRLRDVLKASGMDVDGISLGKIEAPGSWNVGLLGYDQDEIGNQYCCSFPFDKAIDPYGDVILAYEMNGEPIPRSHGFPVRAIIPGT